MNIKIFTGDYTKFLHKEGFSFPELNYKHPLEIIDWVNKIVAFNKLIEKCNILTNSDVIVNEFRIAKAQGLIEDLTIEYYPFDSNQPIFIFTNEKGDFNQLPKGFLDVTQNQLIQLIKLKKC